MKKLVVGCLMLFPGFLLNAQVLDGVVGAFRGGRSDGFASRSTVDALAVSYRGGIGDGYALVSSVVPSTTGFLGGRGDGYAMLETRWSSTLLQVFRGGKGDGYSCCVDAFGSTKIMPLPVVYVYFQTLCSGSSVNLKWATASEFNNDYFTVEKSYDGQHFFMIGTVKGAGNSSSLTLYNFADTDVPNDQAALFYRLKQTDYNGDYSFSKITSAHCKEASDMFFSNLFPNPAQDVVSLIFATKQSGNVELEITNVLGQVIVSRPVAVNEGDNLISADINNFSAGIYLFRVSGFEKGTLSCQKFSRSK